MVARFTPEKPIISADWLLSHLTAPDVRVLDCTYFMPGAPRTGRQAYDAHHIPGARFFDIDDVADTDIALPHMLPPPEKFSSRVRRLGLGDGHRVICYDQNGFLASARVWWMFRVMGHGDVAVLDGGFDAWRTAGGAVEDLPPHFLADRHFTVRPRRDLVRDLDQMKQTVETGATQLVDARSAGRFRGETPEPRAGLRGGHMPSALNVPYGDLLASDGRLKSEDDIRAVFDKAGVDLSKPIINSCGSGVTAAIVALAQSIAGNDGAAVYDGSWTEWGAEAAGTPVVTG
ncbi:MAG: 3-mercaptopyruvate sulfurtransferase [Rhodobacterales bacterium 12-64-8]|nr:MAG: 3-mercaptopyruvate sulfurtransferase [Rhodobacterales bacterium 12-64-8]OYX50755.1 MAG: 3-mercaptopyruvate sulfurtransferase [Alphaproteobacteria bacterium 32-64-14]